MENVMNHTVAMFKGKCYKNIYIKDIKAITIASDPVMCKSSLDGIAQIAVAFVAEGLIVNKNDIVVDTVISDKGRDVIIVKNSSCTGNVTANPLLQAFAQGDRLPVTVVYSSYPANDRFIRFDCKPFIFRGFMYTRSVKEQGICDYELYKKLISMINDVKSNLMKVNKDKLERMLSLIQLGIDIAHFNDVLAGIKKVQPKPNLTNVLTNDTSITEISEEFVKSVTDKIVTTTSYHDLSFNVIVSDMVVNNKITMISADAFIKQSLTEHLTLLRAIEQFIEIYKDDQEIIKSKNLWLLYNKVNK
jgi:hypothetical protein